MCRWELDHPRFRARHSWGDATVKIDAPTHHELAWQKATASLPGGNCVELADAGDRIALRDSKFPGQGAFYFTRAEMAAFVDGVRRGEFDHLT